MNPVPDYLRLTFPAIESDPFDLVRTTCGAALNTAQDVTLDDERLDAFASQLDVEAVHRVTKGHMGENSDVGPEDFDDRREAANFAILFGLLQFGHGFRRELHELCGRGAFKTITRGVKELRRGGLDAARLAGLTIDQIRSAFALPENDSRRPTDSRIDRFQTSRGPLLRLTT
jgi:hypothetical protein